MIKPDYISFSQEIFDECENLRLRLKNEKEFGTSKEYAREATRLAFIVLGDEYGRYLDELQAAGTL